MKKRYDMPSGDGYCSKKCELWQQRSSDLAVSCTLTKHCDIQTEDARFKTLRLSPLPKIHIDIADSSVLPLVFLKSLSILSGCPIFNIYSCHQYRKLCWVGLIEYHPHTRFHYCKLLTSLCHDSSSLAIFQAWIFMGVSIGRCLTAIQVRNLVKLF
jgi:hypothetical protein